MKIIAAIIGMLPAIISGWFFLCMRRKYLRSKAIHQRFMIEDSLCSAAQKRGDFEAAKRHLQYMAELHESHDK